MQGCTVRSESFKSRADFCSRRQAQVRERMAHKSGFHCGALRLRRLKERFEKGRGSRVVETEGKETSPRE